MVTLKIGTLELNLSKDNNYLTYLSESQFEEIDLFYEQKYNFLMDSHNELIEEYVLINQALNSQTSDFLMGNSTSSETKKLETLFNQIQSDLNQSTQKLDIIQSQKNALVECYSLGRDVSYLSKNYFEKIKLL